MISLTTINKTKTTPWDFGNKILYDLCQKNFYHKEVGKIISKVWLIGRSYSAAIERGRKDVLINDNFYINKVAPAFKNSKIDKYLDQLKKYNQLTIDSLPSALEAHNYLTRLTSSITGKNKRSFSSKYLHFHLPNLFFIYDSRAVSSLNYFVKKTPKPINFLLDSYSADKDYAKFVCKCFVFRKEIMDKYDINLSIRHFDNILINFANKKLDEKNKAR